MNSCIYVFFRLNLLRNIVMKYDMANKNVEKPKAETKEALPRHD